MKRIAMILVSAMLSACAGIGGTREADRYFILEASTPAPDPASIRRDVRALPTTAASFYDTQSIAYSRETGTRAYYQFNHWTERPQRAIHALLAARFSADDAQARIILETHLVEIYHDASAPPGTAHIILSAALIDSASRATIARRTFSHSAQSASYDAAGAVRAFDAALGALLDDVVAWVETEGKQH
jgi:ABC-type uncharacterized transport system auxiliary subunit